MREMFFDFANIYFSASPAQLSAELLCRELCLRRSGSARVCPCAENADIVFELVPDMGRDSFSIKNENGKIIPGASGVRGFIYAVGMILRKLTVTENGFCMLPAAFGDFSPHREIRGHQLGYRTTANSYEAWTLEEYDRYYLDLMYFGMNTAEHIPYESGRSKRNALMKYDEEEFLAETAERMDKIDLDLSLWQPNTDGVSDEEAAEMRGKLYSKLARLDHLFIPGGDPGDLPAKQFVSRCIALGRELHKSHPRAKLWPSAQAPHGIPEWGEEFARAISSCPEEIYGVIYGPNHAFSLEETRAKVPPCYPLRFYPDITHNVRCEYPVHFDKNDWHYALTAGLSRECPNPRPKEYERLYHLTEKYFAGSVSYSEGINDDVNKCVWSALDYDRNATAEQAVEDYCRLFFYGTPCEKITRLIFALEENWQGDPAENEGIESTYRGFALLAEEYPSLCENTRFLLLYIRAQCDKLVRDRLLFERGLIEKSRELFERGLKREGEKILESGFPAEYESLREEIEKTARKLFVKTGLQTDVRRYLADNWERGAILETIDLPVTDRHFILNRIRELPDVSPLEFFDRDMPRGCVYHFSVARDGVKDEQIGEPYFNFQGDRPSVNDGTLPVSLFNVFDNYTFRHTARGVPDGEYTLRAVYLDRDDGKSEHHRVTAGGKVIYDGRRFGTLDPEFDRRFGRKGFVSALYKIPAGAVRDGELELEFSEPLMGVMISELFILKN